MGVETAATRLFRHFSLGPGRRTPRRRPGITEPADRSTPQPTRQRRAYLLAIALPLVTAALLIPLRDSHPRLTGLVLILPVLASALTGATGPALVAAVVAGVGYDFLLTQPHYRLAIDDPDEIVAMIVIVAVGAVAGVLSSRLAQAAARNNIRQNELDHLIGFVRSSGRKHTAEQLTDEAGAHIAAVLGAVAWRWRPGYHGGGTAVLVDTGGVVSHVPDLRPDRAELPTHVEIPVGVGNHEIGRFVVTSRPGHLVSDEERTTAAAIATLLAVLTVADGAS
ncbi:MAG: DUF4118 domain-containing protein [Acidimicrobiales bacterium]